MDPNFHTTVRNLSSKVIYELNGYPTEVPNNEVGKWLLCHVKDQLDNCYFKEMEPLLPPHNDLWELTNFFSNIIRELFNDNECNMEKIIVLLAYACRFTKIILNTTEFSPRLVMTTMSLVVADLLTMPVIESYLLEMNE